MKNKNLQKLVFSALLAALCCVSTMVVQIPSPMGGYVNIGDCFVLLSGFLLGPVYGALAAGIGSCLADAFSGYMSYVPATLIIKALMALACALMVRTPLNKYVSRIIAAVSAEAIMVLGYFFWAGVIFGKGFAAAASIPGNLVQAVAGIVLAYVLVAIFDKIKLTKVIQG